MLLIFCKDLRSCRFPQPPRCFMQHCFVFGHVARKSRHVGQFFITSSMLAFILTQYVDSHASSLVFTISMLFRCSYFITLSCAVVLVLLSFNLPWQFYLWLQFNLWMTGMAAVPSLLQLLSMATYRVPVLPGCLGSHYLLLQFLFLLLPCNLVCPYMTLLHWW